MKKFLYVVLVLFMSIVCGQLHAATSESVYKTITLSGTEYNTCPYTVAITDYKGNIIVNCTSGSGVGVASINSIKVVKRINTCNYISVAMFSNGNIHAVCSLTSPTSPAVPPQARYKGGNRDKNLGTYIDANGMYAWVPMPGV